MGSTPVLGCRRGWLGVSWFRCLPPFLRLYRRSDRGPVLDWGLMGWSGYDTTVPSANMPFHSTTIFTLTHLLPLSPAHLPLQKTPFEVAILYNKCIADAHHSFLLEAAILFPLVCEPFRMQCHARERTRTIFAYTTFGFNLTDWLSIADAQIFKYT